MTRLRDPRRYLEEAAHFRELAAAAIDSAKLRDGYLALAAQYERLATLLEPAAVTDSETEQTGIYTGMADKPDPENPADI
jgi:hypothetical protein